MSQVMAAAMAEMGQIKLFGEQPTVAEATLARARKFVYKEKRYMSSVFRGGPVRLESFGPGGTLETRTVG